MFFNFQNLDERTRKLMLEEIELDLKREELYLSKRFSKTGESLYPKLLKDAAENGSEEVLAESLWKNNCFKQIELRKTKEVKVRRDAHLSFAEGEFNRFYIRALCRRVIEDVDGQLVIYRAKNVKIPRSGSQAKIGKSMNPGELLEDLRRNKGVEPALGLPPGPNSGLSIKIQ